MNWLRRRRLWQRGLAAGLALGSLCALIAAVATSQLRASGDPGQQIAAAWREPTPTSTQSASPAPTPTATPTATATKKPVAYPGAAYLVQGGELPDVPYRPTAWVASGDHPETYFNGCHVRHSPEVRVCPYGPEDGAHTIAIVGDSHSAQWLPAFQAIAEDFDFRVLSVTHSACRFDAWLPSDTTDRAQCAQWNRDVIPRLRDLKPDVVFTLGSYGWGGRDRLNAGQIEQWRRLDGIGIPVIAVRDNPWYRFELPPCVVAYGSQARRCGGDRAQLGLTQPVPIPAGYTVPRNVHPLDLTDLYCEATFCPPVIGNIMVYRDEHHITATYARTMGPFMAQAILRLMGWDELPRPLRTPV
jgi:hypothetical protein